jgi:acyl-CoA synthetase (AMP-forming)/AMP-acid ligase II
MPIFTDFQHLARRSPGAPALVSLDGAVSYGSVLAQAGQVAGGLLAAGLRAGDRVAVHLLNRPELVSAYYACLSLGAVLVPVSPKLARDEVAMVLSHGAARFYLGQADVFAPCAGPVGRCDSVEAAWVLDSPGTETTRPGAELLAEPPAGATAAGTREVSPGDLAAIFYTSGTTGRPTGLVMSHATLEAGVDLTAAQGAGDGGATYYMINFANPWGTLVLLASLRRGQPLALSDSNEPAVVLQMLRAHRFGWIGAAPSQYRALVAEAGRSGQPAPELRGTKCVAGGDSCPIDLARDFDAMFAAPLQGVYGLTETGAPVIQQPRIDALDEPSIGWPLPGVGVRIDAAPGDAGELLLTTPSRPVGTWNGTGVDLFDLEQPIRTGDIVRQRPDGCLLFVGREKDQIMVDGYPVSPLDIEQALAQHAAVAAAVVFGVPDPVTGERAIALVEPVPGQQPTPDDLFRHLSDRIGTYKHPGEIHLVGTVPVMASGKLSRQRLAADYLASRADSATAH